jgi:hypothetical protein
MNDGGLMYWQQLGAHEVDEFLAWLDGIEFERAMAQPVNAPEKESGNEQSDCK